MTKVCLQRPFGAWYCFACAGVNAGSGIEGAAQRLKQRLNFMMIIAAIQHTGMQIQPTMRRNAFEEVWHQVGTELANPGRGEVGIEDRIRTPTQIKRHKAQRLIHGHIAMRGAYNPTSLAKRLIERLAQADTHILSGMVFVYMQIAVCLNDDIKQAMFGKQRQHMIKEANTCRYISAPGTIKRQR
jgi:hypothetical protein